MKEDIIRVEKKGSEHLKPFKRAGELIKRVDNFAAELKRVYIFTALFQFFTLFFTLFLLLWGYDRFFQPHTNVRGILLITNGSLLFGFGLYKILVPFLFPLTRARAAAIIEQTFPQAGRLKCAVEYNPVLEKEGFLQKIESNDLQSNDLQSGKLNSDFRGSRAIMALAVADAVSYNGNIDFNLALEKTQFKRALIFFVSILCLLFINIALFPDSAHYSTERYLFADQKEYKLLKTRYKVSPGNSSILQGGDFTVKILSAGALPYNPEILFYNEQMKLVSRVSIKRKELEKGFEYVYKNAQHSFYYAVKDENSRHELYFVKLLISPVITDINVKYAYPAYTGIKSTMTDKNTGHVAVLAGSSVWVEMNFSKAVKKIIPKFENSLDYKVLQEKETSCTIFFKVVRDNKYSIGIYDGQGLFNDPEPVYTIKCIPDKSPAVSIIEPGKDMDLPEDYTCRIKARSSDDYGIGRISIMTSMRGSEYSQFTSYEVSGITNEIFYSALLDFSDQPLGPDDVVLYYAQVWDRDNIGGPNSGKSKIYSLRVPSVFEFFEDIEEDQEYQEQELEKALKEQKELTRQTRELADKIEKTREFKWEDRKKLSSIVKQEKEIKEQIKKLQENLKNNLESMEKNSLISPDIIEKMQKMQQLFNDLMDEDMKKLVQELQNIQNKMNLSEQDKKLFKAAHDQKEFEKKIERTLELLKKVKAQQKMDALANMAQELLKKQQELEAELEKQNKSNGPGNEEKLKDIANKQQRLANETARLQKEIEESSSQMEQDFKNAAMDLKKALDTLKEHQVEQNMAQASKKLGMPQSKASTTQSMQMMKKASEGLTAAGKQLKSAASSMKAGNKKAIMDKLDKLISRVMLWSLRQSQITPDILGLRETGASSRDTLARISNEELDLLKTGRKSIEMISDLGQMTFMMSPSIPGLASRAYTKTALIKDNLGIGRWTLAVAACDDLTSSLNALCRELIDMEDKVSQSAGGMGFDQFMEQMKKLLKQQQQMGQKMDMFSQRQGSTPLMQKMQSQALKQMALEQSMIRESMEKLAQEMSHNNALSKQMKALAGEMEALEKEMEKGSLSKKSMLRQQQLVERMLDTNKSMNQKKKSRQRKGRTSQFAGAASAGEAIEESELIIEKKRIRPVDYSGPENIPGEYEELINSYFKALSEKGAL
jgi:hypothetical protein